MRRETQKQKKTGGEQKKLLWKTRKMPMIQTVLMMGKVKVLLIENRYLFIKLWPLSVFRYTIFDLPQLLIPPENGKYDWINEKKRFSVELLLMRGNLSGWVWKKKKVPGVTLFLGPLSSTFQLKRTHWWSFNTNYKTSDSKIEIKNWKTLAI